MLCAVLGLLTTVGLAWMLAVMPMHDRGRATYFRRGSGREYEEWVNPMGQADCLEVQVYHDAGRWMVTSWAYGPEFQPLLGTPAFVLCDDVAVAPRALVPWWGNRAALPWLNGSNWPSGSNSDARHIEASGWPLPALSAEPRWSTPGQLTIRSGISLGSERPVNRFFVFQRSQRVLPLMPVWHGLVLDTTLWSVAWFALLFMPGSVRRAWRRRRGVCEWCAYSRSGIAAEAKCPECGEAVGRTHSRHSASRAAR